MQGQLTSLNDDLKMLKEHTAESQVPFAPSCPAPIPACTSSWCSTRRSGICSSAASAGNIATADLIASLEHGVAVFGTTTIMVLGHGNCGAVDATIKAKAVPGQISTLYRSIRPAVEQAGAKLEAAIKANAKIQAGLLASSSPVIAEQIKNNQLKVVAAYYDLASGASSMVS